MSPFWEAADYDEKLIYDLEAQYALREARKLPTASDGKIQRLENGLLDVYHGGKFEELIKRNYQRSPLLRLPPEIRHKIFSYAVGGESFVLAAVDPIDSDPRTVWQTEKLKHCFSLLRVCRQLYSETATLPFSANTFVVDDLWAIQNWMDFRLPVEREAITDIQVDCSVFEKSWNLSGFSRLQTIRACLVLDPGRWRDTRKSRRTNKMWTTEFMEDLKQKIRNMHPDVTVVVEQRSCYHSEYLEYYISGG